MHHWFSFSACRGSYNLYMYRCCSILARACPQLYGRVGQMYVIFTEYHMLLCRHLTYYEMHIRDQTSLFSFLLIAQFIVNTKVPIWVGLAKNDVLKGAVGLGTCILERVC